MEKIVEEKTCKHCDCQFDITDKDLEFYEKVSPTFNGEKYQIPSPTFCPDCRQQRRLAIRNDKCLYKTKCDYSGKNIVSIYAPQEVLLGCNEQSGYKVYDRNIWISDNYDPTDYGVDYDFTKPFFEQFKSLFGTVPKPNVFTDGDIINSEYTNFTGWLKDCYLVFDSGKSENCMYGNLFIYSKNCIDCSIIIDGDECYECVNCTNCHEISFSKYCIDCDKSSYLDNCIGCKSCFGCKNLNNKSYCFLNEQLTKTEYQKEISNITDDKKIKEKVDKLYSETINKNLRNINTDNVVGDSLDNCKNAKYCYECDGIEDCKYCYNVLNNTHNCYDVTMFGEDMERCYEVGASGGVKGKQSINNIYFSSHCFYGGNNLLYCSGAHNNSKYCFGCTGLKGNSYCILNKQYTKEEYNLLVPKIIAHMRETGEWGEFFPSELSPFGYNETLANEYFPLTKEEAISKGFKWSNYEAPFPKVDKTISADKLPDNIGDIPDDILNWAIKCETTNKPFKITKQELEFYRKHNLPIPRRHPDQRHLDRMSLRNPRKLYDRKCDKCGVDMKTCYSSDRKEIVYCEKCYNKSIY